MTDYATIVNSLACEADKLKVVKAKPEAFKVEAKEPVEFPKIVYQRQYKNGHCSAYMNLGALFIKYAYDIRPDWMKLEECPRTWGTHILFSLENIEVI